MTVPTPAPAEAHTRGDGFCPTHKPKCHAMGYAEHSDWMDRQRGEQRMCPTCRRWLFRSEFGPGWADAAHASARPTGA